MNIKKMKMNYNDLSFLRTIDESNERTKLGWGVTDTGEFSFGYLFDSINWIDVDILLEKENLMIQIKQKEKRIKRIKNAINLILRCLSTVTTSIKSVVKLITPKDEFEGVYKNENENENENEWWDVK